MTDYSLLADYDRYAVTLDEVDYIDSESCPNGFCPISDDLLEALQEDELEF